MKQSGKISTIELWRFILTIGIALGHLNSFIWSNTNETLIFTGGRVLSFFLFLSGYFLMAHYQKHKKTDSTTPAKSAWKYTGERFKALYPTIFMGVLFAFIVRNAI